MLLPLYLHRIHAEFQLNDVPDFPFWFTPGQFTGNIVLSRDSSHVRQFTLYVPNDRSVNNMVDSVIDNQIYLYSLQTLCLIHSESTFRMIVMLLIYP